MAELGKKDFFEGTQTKTASNGKYAGKTRTEVVFEKIKNKDPFIIGKTSSGNKVFGITFDTKTWPYILSYSKLKSGKIAGEEKITKIFKDPNFGGGAGSGGGAAETAITESGQCYYTSLVFNVIKKQLKRTDCTPINLKKAAEFVEATINLDNFIKKGPADWADNDIYLRTANLIYKDYKSKFKTPVYCHRGSKFMDNLYKAKKEVMKIDDFSAPGSFSNDKWNPGDIWLSSLPVTSDPLKETKDWQELNTKVLEEAGELRKNNKTSLLGVSLKKLGKSGKVEKFNLAERQHNTKVKFINFTYGKTGDFFSSIDIYLKFDVAELQLRAFNSTSAWQGEIKGLSAAGGKIGGGNLNFYLEKYAKNSIGYTGENKPKGNSWKETTANEVDINKMYKLYVEFNEKQSKKIAVVNKDEFMKKLKEKGTSFLFSKNMCLMFLNSFYNTNSITRNKISTEIIRYAASNTDISSFYIKVS